MLPSFQQNCETGSIPQHFEASTSLRDPNVTVWLPSISSTSTCKEVPTFKEHYVVRLSVTCVHKK